MKDIKEKIKDLEYDIENIKKDKPHNYKWLLDMYETELERTRLQLLLKILGSEV